MPTESYARFDRRDGMVGIAFPRFLDGRKISQGTDVNRRTELGKLIADPDNEAMAKAFVNRTWAHFLGRGFVEPVDDFGPHNPPSHPELLDQLAKEFKDSGYSVKKLCRLIANSRAYQQSSVKGSGRRKAEAKLVVTDKEEGLFAPDAAQADDPRAVLRFAAHRHAGASAGAGDEDNKKRDAWLRQFLFTFANDEAEESTNFQGTIPQALMMMNGELMQEALRASRAASWAMCASRPAQLAIARGVHGRFDLSGRAQPASRTKTRSTRRDNTSGVSPIVCRFCKICSGLCSTRMSLS